MSGRDFRGRLATGAPFLLDGGMGSALIARGLASGQAPELWNLERPEAVADVHREFVLAGSEAVQTNTFGGNPIRLAAYGLEYRCRELNAAAVRLARHSGAAFVIGDIGPTSEYLPPVGKGDAARWREAFELQAVGLAGEGVDAVHVETMSDVREARLALESVRSVAPDLPVMVSLTFERRKRGFFTVMGDPLVESLRSLLDAGADVVGANCSLTSGDIRVLAAAAVAAGGPLVVQPNAGQPERVDDGSVRYAQTPDEFAADMAEVARSGVAVVGGCCGTDARFIAALRARLGVAA